MKTAATAAGYPAQAFSGHSLRTRFLTGAGWQSANLVKTKEHSRHVLLEMVAKYVHDHERFREHGLLLRHRPPKRRAKAKLSAASCSNEVWAMNFVHG